MSIQKNITKKISLEKILKEKINFINTYISTETKLFLFYQELGQESKELLARKLLAKELLNIKLIFREIILNLEREYIKINEEKYNAISRI